MQLSGIYDSQAIQPVCKIKENLSILTLGKWAHYVVEYEEGIPPGPAGIVDMVTVAGQTTLAANGSITKRVVAVLQLNDNEFLHLRWMPIDNVEGLLWELASQARLATRSLQSRVSRDTILYDPTLATTTFWVMGLNRDMQLEVRNPMGYATPTARFIFFGNRMVLKAWDFDCLGVKGADKEKLAAGDLETVRKYIGATTWVPAEGRPS